MYEYLYNPPKKITNNANALIVDTIFQNNPPDSKPNRAKSLIIIELKNSKDYPIINEEVRLFSKKFNIVHVAKSDNDGKARIYVEANNEYILGIRKFDNFDKIFIPNRINLGLSIPVQLVDIEIEETNVNDTIRQVLPQKVEPTSERVYVHLKVTDWNKMPLENEEVYLDNLDNNVVYLALSLKNGIARFLVPKGNRYNLNFKYERDIDILDYPYEPGLHTTEINFSYIGSKKVEEFYNKTKRDTKGFLTEFMKTPVFSLKFDKSLLKRTKQGFKVDFEKESNNTTPTIADRTMFINGGYYTSELYALDAVSGKVRWGVRLAENGASSAVYRFIKNRS